MKTLDIRGNMALIVYSATMFLSAAAAFSMQPMVGKMMLPLVGGTPAGWAVALTFFQVMLLVGYLLAWLLSRFTPRTQAALYIMILVIGATFLPILLGNSADTFPAMPGPLDIFILLAKTTAIPFIALSATSSTIQRLFMTTGHSSAADPYFLYAASNLGSFVGLLAYPFVIEPWIGLAQQAHDWQYLYLSLIVCGAFCLILSGKNSEEKSGVSVQKNAVDSKKRLEWLALAFFPSALLVGVTTLIASDVVSAPMIWILPLAVYLLTFVLAFSKKPIVSVEKLQKTLPLALTSTLILFFLQQSVATLGFVAIAVYLGAFGAVALLCHTRLASLRPNKETGALAEFYLMISLGGALGGLLNVFAAPIVFNRAVEYALLFLALPLLFPREPEKSRQKIALLCLIAVALLLANFRLPPPTWINSSILQMIPIGTSIVLAIVAMFLLDNRSPYLYQILALFFIISASLIPNGQTIAMHRNFFGTIRIYDAEDISSGLKLRRLMHGTTLHGIQAQEDKNKHNPRMSYYNPLAPIFDIYHPRKIGIIGLGAGILNCYAAPDRAFTFFEIDPGIIDVAQNQFSYLSGCKSEQPPRILMGDGRLELKKLESEKFDLILLDAFSSDTIPTHLLTREAFQLYIDRLEENGILVAHITNRYFTLEHALAATAAATGLKTKIIKHSPKTGSGNILNLQSTWVVAARPDVDLSKLDSFEAKDLLPRALEKAWTDDYTDVLGSLRYFNHVKTH